MRSNVERVKRLEKKLYLTTDREYKLFLSNFFQGNVCNINYGIAQRMKQSDFFMRLDSKFHIFDSKN